MPKKVVAVDVGSGMTGVTDGEKELFFPSLVTEAPEENLFGMERVNPITFNEHRYLVGEDAKSFSQPDARANTRTDDWAGSEPWFALLYAALDQMEVEGPVTLVTGLPQRIWGAQRKALGEVLGGMQTWKVGLASRSCQITPVVIPQAAAATIYAAASDPSVREDEIGVIDIGTYTTGLAVLDHMRPVGSRSGGLHVGVEQIMLGLRERLTREHGYTPDPAKLPSILRQGWARIRGEQVDVKPLIASVSTAVSGPIFELTGTLWDGGDDLRIMTAGGGGEFFFPAIKERMPHAELLDDAFEAVLRGLFAYGQSQ